VVASGNAQAGLSSIPALINANAAGLPVLGVADLQSALPGQPLETYLVRADSRYTSAADLRESNFAVNLWYSSFHYTALMALEQKGVAEDELTFSLLPFGDQAVALAAGEVDVIGLMEPYTSQALATYGDEFKVLFTAHDVFNEKQFGLIFVNRVWAENNPEAARAFVGGISDAVNWIESHQDEAKVIIAKYTEIPAENVPEYHFQAEGKVVEADVQFWLDYLIERGDVTVDWLTPEMIGSNQYQ
jgi:ABC-type nitrate/sulfonate/bicarbonate transport system substrate-binding protein